MTHTEPGAQAARTAPIVFVHGLWMNGLEATLLRQRLMARGHAVHQFHYPTTSADAAGVLAALAALVREVAGPARVHLVGHSLGGLVVLRLIEAYPDLPVRRAVLLGAPARGSRAARAVRGWPGASYLFGALADEELLRDTTRRLTARIEIGIIAGTRGAGLGGLVGSLPEPNDGTVALDETRVEGAKATLVLRVSHMGMMVSRAVAANVATFLEEGRFLPAPG